MKILELVGVALVSLLAGLVLRTLLDRAIIWLLERSIRRALVGKSRPPEPLEFCGAPVPGSSVCDLHRGHAGAHHPHDCQTCGLAHPNDGPRNRCLTGGAA